MGSYVLCLVLSGLWVSLAAPQDGSCPSGVHTKTTSLFGSKTGYENVAYLPDDPLDSEGCTVKGIWMLIRHGARNPGEDLIEDMQTRLVTLRDKIVKNGKDGNGSLCSEGLEALEKWKLEISKEQENWLTPSGRAEQTALGGRWSNRMGDSWISPFDPDDYLVRTTPTERTKDSAKGFIQGFFKDNNVHLEVVDEGDPVLKPYETCNKYTETVEDNPTTYKERDKFFNGKEMNLVLEMVQKRTGVNDMEMEDLELMYEMLRFEEAWQEGDTAISPWRSMFSEADIEVLKYLNDLEYYHTEGYGNDLAPKIACETVEDLLASLNDIAASKESPKGLFSFSHTGIVLKLFTRLGLFKPSIAPNASNFGIPETKVWNIGLLDPFSSNFAAVLFSCPSDPEPHKIQMFVQEKPVPSQECGSSKCSLKTFQDLVSRDYDCDLQAFCNSGQHPTMSIFPFLALGSSFVWITLCFQS